MGKRVAIADLRPTQMTLGMFFVGQRRAEFAALSAKKLKKLVAKKSVPAVRGPDKRYWMVDRHHFCRALHETGVDKVEVDKVLDCNHLGKAEFAHFMEKSGLIHPYDADGERRGFADLPATITDLVDDPYRTLAGLVRDKGGFRKEKRPYAEFLWADFYRGRIDRALLTGDFSKAVEAGARLARSRKARHLPGWE